MRSRSLANGNSELKRRYVKGIHIVEGVDIWKIKVRVLEFLSVALVRLTYLASEFNMRRHENDLEEESRKPVRGT